MKFSALLLAAHTASVVAAQPDGSALLQLRKMSVLSASSINAHAHTNANASSRARFNPYAPYPTAPCDKDDLASRIEDLDLEKDSQSETLEASSTELTIRESLVTSELSKLEGLKEVLTEKQQVLQERESSVTELQASIEAVSANLTSYREQWSVKSEELSAAEKAESTASAAAKSARKASFSASMNYRRKSKAQEEQMSLVGTSTTAVADAKAALEAGQQDESAACTAAADSRAEATAAASDHEAAVKQLETATTEHTAAVTARQQRKSEMSTAKQNLEAAKDARTRAANDRATECKQAENAETKEGAADDKYRAKQIACAALAEEEKQLLQQQDAAQVAYDAAASEATSATSAHGRATQDLASAKATKEAASKALTDAQEVQASAVAKETTVCAKAEAAHVVVTGTTSELHQARQSQVQARFADFRATAALTRATSQESSACDAASKAQCAMNRAKSSLDAAKERSDEAVAEREAQDAVVTVAKEALDSAEKSVEEADSTVTTAVSSYKESGKTKTAAKTAQTNAGKLLKDAKLKYNKAVLAQGRAKASLDGAMEQVTCVTNRHAAAVEDFKTANAAKEEKEDVKQICDEDLKAAPNPQRANELLERLQVAYDGVEMALAVWKDTKSKRDSLKEELDTKTNYKQTMKAEFEAKKANTAEAKASRDKLKGEHKKAKVAFDAAMDAHTAAYEHMVSWQNRLEVRVDSHNSAVDVHNKAVHLQEDLVSAENLAKRLNEEALETHNQKVADHEKKTGKCTEAGTKREAAEAAKEKSATELASAAVLMESLKVRLDLETTTWETAKSHCRAAGDDRVEADAALALAEKASSDAEAAESRAQTAADTAAAEEKAALDKRDAAKTTLDAAVQAATQKTKETMDCDKVEEELRVAWVSADAHAEAEQKQCATACAALTAANGAVEVAQTAYNTAVTNHENAEALATSAEATKNEAAAAEGAAETTATEADTLAAKKEQNCAKLTAEAETLKSELDSAESTLKSHSDDLAQKQADAQAADAVRKEASDANTKAVEALALAKDAAVLAQEALDDVELCIETLEMKLNRLEAELPQAQDYVADAQASVAKEETKISEVQEELSGYKDDVERLRQEVQAAQTALDAIVKELNDAETTLENCPASRCTLPNPPTVGYTSSGGVNLVDGATFRPECESGYKADFCAEASGCKDEVQEMTCKDGQLEPATFRCAPILTGSLTVFIKEGRKLSFGEKELDWDASEEAGDFVYHPLPSDPYVLVETCPGGEDSVKQQTAVKTDSYDATWDHKMEFRIDGPAPCTTFRIAVRDDREDDPSQCEADPMEYIGAVEKLQIKKVCNKDKTECRESPLESFMTHPNKKQHRRVILKRGGVLDFWFKWSPDLVGPIMWPHS